ncbi:MAG: hypothetical protein SFU86_03735 [Pirellulaceae bacterium]|nr:hypothetical protein [Pirellulaceae bacterium]
MPVFPEATRRRFLQGSAAVLGTGLLTGRAWPAENPRPKVAAVFTEFRFRSHAYNILINLLGPYLFRGQWIEPGAEVVSFYADQFPDNDMAREVSRRFGIPIFKTIDEALCRGGKELAVDAVLIIGEHGEYPLSDLGVKMYPRKEFFDQSVAVMKRSKRFVPIFNDKHLSYRWDYAKAMYDEAREKGIPLMAGSSVPLAERRPAVEWPQDAVVEEAIAIHGGGMEVYDFHGFELLQSFIEARRGGETGISRVQLVSGDAFRQAEREGRWSRELANVAMSAEDDAEFERQPRPSANASVPEPPGEPHALLLSYKDGTKATVLKMGSTSNRWNFACRVRGQAKPLATAMFNGPWGNRNLFNALTNAIIHFFQTGKPPYPVERTLLASGVLDVAMRSHHAGDKPLASPQLEIAYHSDDWRAYRETGESWRIITPEIPQPTTFAPGPVSP